MDDILRSINNLLRLKIIGGILSRTTATLLSEKTTIFDLWMENVHVNDDVDSLMDELFNSRSLSHITMVFNDRKFQDSTCNLVDQWLRNNRGKYECVEISVDKNTSFEDIANIEIRNLSVYIPTIAIMDDSRMRRLFFGLAVDKTNVRVIEQTYLWNTEISTADTERRREWANRFNNIQYEVHD